MVAIVIGFWLSVLTILFVDILIAILQKWGKFPTSMYRISKRSNKYYAEYFLVWQKLELGVYKGWGWHPVVYYKDSNLAQVYSKEADVGFSHYSEAEFTVRKVKEKIESNKNTKTYIQ